LFASHFTSPAPVFSVPWSVFFLFFVFASVDPTHPPFLVSKSFFEFFFHAFPLAFRALSSVAGSAVGWSLFLPAALTTIHCPVLPQLEACLAPLFKSSICLQVWNPSLISDIHVHVAVSLYPELESSISSCAPLSLSLEIFTHFLRAFSILSWSLLQFRHPLLCYFVNFSFLIIPSVFGGRLFRPIMHRVLGFFLVLYSFYMSRTEGRSFPTTNGEILFSCLPPI